MRLLVVIACSVLQACALFIPAPVPMASVKDSHAAGKAKCLLVFLPGAGDRAESFLRQKFVESVRAGKFSVDLVSADATMGYYARGIVAERLETDVLGPAQAAGYQETWLVGASMGGFGSLFYAHQRPGQVQGVLALSPFLGGADVTDAIRAAGGLAAWQAPAESPSDARNYSAQLWRWLQDVTVRGAPGPEIYVGWGDRERLAADDALLGAVLPADHVFHAPGLHGWDTWRDLFSQWLAHSTFAQRCTSETR